MPNSHPVAFERFAEPIPTGLGGLVISPDVVEVDAVCMATMTDSLSKFIDTFWQNTAMLMDLHDAKTDHEGNFPVAMRAAVGLLLQDCGINVELPDNITALRNPKMPLLVWDIEGANNG